MFVTSVFLLWMWSFLLWVLQWSLLMFWPCFTFLPNYSMIAICSLSFLSFIVAFPLPSCSLTTASLLPNEKLDYCHWFEPLPLKIFIFFLCVEVLSFYVFIFSILKNCLFMFDILIEFICSKWKSAPWVTL